MPQQNPMVRNDDIPITLNPKGDWLANTTRESLIDNFEDLNSKYVFGSPRASKTRSVLVLLEQEYLGLYFKNPLDLPAQRFQESVVISGD